MFSFLEPEEFIGRHWHRLAGEANSWPRFPDASVSLDSVRGSLGVFFHGLGGDRALPICGVTASSSGHRLSLRQRLGRDDEALARPKRDDKALYLPPHIDCFPTTALNHALYFWLAAFLSQCPIRETPTGSLLHDDVLFLRDAHQTTAIILTICPGLVETHRQLGTSLLLSYPTRSLPQQEKDVELAVLRLLGQANDGGPFWPWISGETTEPLPPSPPRYRPFLPVPLWGEARDDGPSSGPRREDAAPNGGNSANARDGTMRKGTRREDDQINRKDSLILNRFEKILSMIQSLNINREVDDDDEENARKALEDADEIVLASRPGTPSTRLRFDLDLPPETVDETRLATELTYPEWHCDKHVYLPDYCSVVAGVASEQGEDWTPNAETRRLIRHVRRKFEALRPRHEILKAQVDGFDLDMDALVRSRCDLMASGAGSDRIHVGQRRQGRDLAVTVLVDVSLSTDGWIEDRRIIDVEKEALTVLSNGLEACGDSHSILTFTSRRRNWIRVETVKDFDDPFGPLAMRRLSALKPGFYTRIGPAVRHATHLLLGRANRHRLLILLTDGKPNDIDHYEGRYGIEDTRRAIQEARRAGIAVFGVTVDREAQDYFPTIFGRGGYAIIDHVARLPSALPNLYRHLISA